MTKDVEPYTIVGGSPAKPIRKRFSEEEIAWLLEMNWWDWSDEMLKEAMPLMTEKSVKDLYSFWKSKKVDRKD